jgi:hypothetical protein
VIHCNSHSSSAINLAAIFSVEQGEACKQISCVQSSKKTYKRVQELVVNVRIMLIIFFFIAFIDTTSIPTSRILEQFADPITSIS